MRDSLLLGEAPFASHALYTQPGVLRDDIHEERVLGINAGFQHREAAVMTIFYVNLGWSSGMKQGLEHCKDTGSLWIIRTLPPDWDRRFQVARFTAFMFATAVFLGIVAGLFAASH